MEENEEYEVDVEVLEFALNEEEIDEFIGKLKKLKETKKKISFEIDDEHELAIDYLDAVD